MNDERQRELEQRRRDAAIQSQLSSMARREFGTGYQLLIHDRDYSAAISSLSLAIKHDPHDSRFFFFRGLAYCRMGRTSEGYADYREGGRLERVYGNHGIGIALERIQGQERLELERFRTH